MPDWRLSASVALFFLIVRPVFGAAIGTCSQGAPAFSPCELTFDWRDGEVPPSTSPYKDEILNVEFRSPQHTTFLIRAFWNGGHTLRARFTPTLPGVWSYHVSGSIKR